MFSFLQVDSYLSVFKLLVLCVALLVSFLRFLIFQLQNYFHVTLLKYEIILFFVIVSFTFYKRGFLYFEISVITALKSLLNALYGVMKTVWATLRFFANLVLYEVNPCFLMYDQYL